MSTAPSTARTAVPELRVTAPAPRRTWRAALAADPAAVPTQTPEWCEWLTATRGWADASRLYEFESGRRFVLPLMARGAAGMTFAAESMPFGFGYGGVVATEGPPTVSEAAAMLSDLARLPAIRTGLTPLPTEAEAWCAAAPAGALRLPYLAQVLDLSGGFDMVWSTRYRKDTRKKVRRAGELPLEILVDDPASADAFEELNGRSVQRWARQRGQPQAVARLVERHRDRARQFASGSRALGELCSTWSAHLHGKPVAAYATLRLGRQVVSWLSAIDRRLADQTRAGHLLTSLAIEAACASGARWFQFGESVPGSGVELFKSGFGARRVHYDALRFERLPVTTAEQRLRGLASRLNRGADR
jgi:hypothetical protein